MNLDYSADDVSFRKEVRDFIAANYPPDLRAKQESGAELGKEDFLAWHRILAKKGWVAPAWPKEYGGPGWNPIQKFICAEEMASAGTVPILPFGIAMVAPVIQAFGTPEQKAKFLPPTHDGDIWWCQGYSEPGAGSDLASLTTRAVREGDHYIVNGQKTWTTLAQHADWGFFLVRTDPAAKKQEGISFLLIDMKSPGVTVRPIITLDGAHEVNEVWLENVRVPVENRVYKENEGWTCAKFLLAHERTGIAGVARSKRGLEKLRAIAANETQNGRPLADDLFFGRRMAELEIDLMALRIHRATQPLERGRRQRARPGILAPQDQGHRDPAARDRTRPGSRRSIRRAAPRRCDGARRQRLTDRPGPRAWCRRHLLQHAQGLDLRRFERDPAQYHRQGRARALISGGFPSFLRERVRDGSPSAAR